MRNPCRELQLSATGVNQFDPFQSQFQPEGGIGVGPGRTGNTADAVDDVVHHLLSDGVVAAGIVVGGILLAADEELGVEELAVAAGADLVDGGRI